jgi:hypothetical protein
VPSTPLSGCEYATKWPKAVAKITDDLDVLLEFYNYPAEHWVHLRTTNPLWVDLRHRPPSAAGHQGARFEKGLLVERPDESGGGQQVA